jgi:RNA polymerase sigma factor (sigma-70 family)
MLEKAQPPEMARLVAGVLSRDQGSWEEILNRYGPLVRAMVGTYRMQEADNQDAIQNTWLRVIERLHTLRDPSCLAAWLVTIARRECLALLARARREQPYCDSADNLADITLGPEATVLLAEACGAVRVAVEELPLRRRKMIKILYSERENPNYITVSNVTGMPVGSIGPTRMRAMSSLRQSLKQSGFGSADAVPA